MKFARIMAATATACAFALLPAEPSLAATRDVDIPGRFFQPPGVTITVGSTVRWTNTSGERHTVRATSDSAERFRSSTNCRGALLFNDCIKPGESFAHTFQERGTFTYYCELHGSDFTFPNCGMCGRVTVVRPSSGGTIAPTTSPSGSGSPTPTTSSPSPSPNVSASPTPSAGATSPAASGDDDNRPTNILAIAAAAVALLGGSGFLIYRTMIRR